MVDFYKFIIASCDGCNGCTMHYAGCLVVVKVVMVVQHIMLVVYGGCEGCQGCTIHYSGCLVVVVVVMVVQYIGLVV